MLAVAFDLYLEARNYITEILTVSLAFKPCACNTRMTSDPSPLKKLSGYGRLGKVAKIALAYARVAVSNRLTFLLC